jgi:hypothetical protein
MANIVGVQNDLAGMLLNQVVLRTGESVLTLRRRLHAEIVRLDIHMLSMDSTSPSLGHRSS